MTNASHQYNNYEIIIDKTISLCYNNYIIKVEEKGKTNYQSNLRQNKGTTKNLKKKRKSNIKEKAYGKKIR